MKKQPRRFRVQRRFDGRHRRLTFERCEERLTLSGSSVVSFDAAASEGGFISLDAGDYLSPASNDFLGDPSGIVTQIGALAPLYPAQDQSLILNRWYDLNYFGGEGHTFDSSLVEAGIAVSVFNVDPVVIQPATTIFMGVATTSTWSDYDLRDGLSISSLIIGWNDTAIDVGTGLTIAPSSDVSGETLSIDAIANGESQTVVVEAVGDQLPIGPSGTFAQQSIPQIDLAYPLSERLDQSFTRFQDHLQKSVATSAETTLATTTLTESALNRATFSGTTDADWSTRVGPSVVVVDESLPTTEAVEVVDATKTPRESVAVVGDPGEVPQDDARRLPVRFVLLANSEHGDRIELPNQNRGDAFAYSAEGGPIEVALAVVETQQAYEAELFSEVAALLDEQNILAQPTTPVAQPFSGELARSVAFETVGLEATADSAQFDDSHAPNADISASAAAVHVNEADTEPSRALAFAQWPLVFSATVGAVLVGSRRRSQSNAAQATVP